MGARKEPLAWPLLVSEFFEDPLVHIKLENFARASQV
jgi:hypothetical protein